MGKTAQPAESVAPTRNERRKARTSSAILEAAERILRRDGYDGASIDDIATAADVGIGSIYQHFGSKEGLLLAMIERAIEANQRYLGQGFAAEGTPIEKLAQVQQAYLRFCAEQPFYFDLIILEYERRASTYAPEAVARISAIATEVLDRIALLIGDAQAAKEIRPLDARNAARFLWAALNGLLAAARRPDELKLNPEELQAVLTTGMEIVLQGLLTRRGISRLST
jgi:AcrR family transcriptional regulator